MNILCLEQFSNLGGGQRSLLDLLPAFAARGWQALVVAPEEGPFTEAVRKLGNHAECLKYGSYTSIRKPAREIWQYACELPRLAREIRRLVYANDIDLLYVNGSRLLPPAAWISRQHSIPLVFHCHSRLLQPPAIFLAGEALQFAAARVIACCRYAVEPLRTYVRHERISILHNGVGALNGFVSRPSIQLRRIGVLGRIETEKGQMEFVNAARIVVETFPDCRFSIVGAPLFSSTDYYNRVVTASRGLPIEFPGWQNDISRVFADLDLLVVPSTPLEATPRVILEAYNAGVPVVAFPSGGIPETIEDGETGFLTSAITPKALAERIISVLYMTSADIAAVVMKAYRKWHSHYRLEMYQERVCEVFSPAQISKPRADQ
jgi:glycosyltransferase involved in cell wall biosynthesis